MQLLPFHDFISCLKSVRVSESVISSGNEAPNGDLYPKYREGIPSAVAVFQGVLNLHTKNTTKSQKSIYNFYAMKN